MKIKSVVIDTVKPYERNPRHNDEAVQKVVASLREFGWQQPIVVDSDLVVIAGHTRLKAAHELGMKRVPIHVAEGLSEAQVKAYRLADNRTGAEANWNQDLLSLELDDIAAFELDLALTGFDPDEISDIRISGDGEGGFPDLPSGGRSPFQQMTFTLHDSQAEQVIAAIGKAKSMGDFESPNENSNGNALARICEAFNGFGEANPD